MGSNALIFKQESVTYNKNEIRKLENVYGERISPVVCRGAGDDFHRCHEIHCKEDMISCINGCGSKLLVCDPTKFKCPSKGYCEKCYYKWCAATGNASQGVRRVAEPTPE